MGKATVDKLRPGETFFGVGAGILVPVRPTPTGSSGARSTGPTTESDVLPEPGTKAYAKLHGIPYDPKIDREVQMGPAPMSNSVSAESGMPEAMKRELDRALSERMRQGLKEQFSPSAPTGEFRSPTGDESEDSKN
jgi:hypothetical protein